MPKVIVIQAGENLQLIFTDPYSTTNTSEINISAEELQSKLKGVSAKKGTTEGNADPKVIKAKIVRANPKKALENTKAVAPKKVDPNAPTRSQKLGVTERGESPAQQATAKQEALAPVLTQQEKALPPKSTN